jgi:hypothetical protein
MRKRSRNRYKWGLSFSRKFSFSSCPCLFLSLCFSLSVSFSRVRSETHSTHLCVAARGGPAREGQDAGAHAQQRERDRNGHAGQAELPGTPFFSLFFSFSLTRLSHTHVISTRRPHTQMEDAQKHSRQVRTDLGQQSFTIGGGPAAHHLPRGQHGEAQVAHTLHINALQLTVTPTTCNVCSHTHAQVSEPGMRHGQKPKDSGLW